MTSGKRRSVLYVFRGATGGFSIERVFAAVMRHVEKYRPCAAVSLPQAGAQPLDIVKNLLFLRRRRGDIYHVTGDVHYALLALIGRKTVLTVHDCCILHRGGRMRRFIFRLLWFYLPCRIATRITCISEESKAELLEHVGGIADKISVVPDPLPPGFEYVPKEFDAECPRILHFNKKSNKNLDNTISALKGIPCELAVIGKLTESQLRKLRENRIRYVGMEDISDAGIIEEYRKCDLLCFPSTYEGFGMPIIEAQAIGRPVVTSDLAPMNRISGGAAVLADPDSPDSIRRAVLKLIDEPELRTGCVEKGLENVKRFSAELVSAAYEEIYEELDA